MPEAATPREQAEKALRLARPTSDNLTSARLIKLAKEYISQAEALEERKAMTRPMSENVPTRGLRLE
jgi:hypothetical protein